MFIIYLPIKGPQTVLIQSSLSHWTLNQPSSRITASLFLSSFDALSRSSRNVPFPDSEDNFKFPKCGLCAASLGPEG